MKRCNSCGQILSQKITTCPACGSAVMKGLTRIDDYIIEKIIHEGHSTMVCKAVKGESQTPVSIRLFTPKSGVDETVAERLKKELLELQKLPEQHFVQHYAVKKSKGGLWFRVSEWVHAASWGEIFVSGVLNDPRKMVMLFHNIASVLELLHRQDHFMPYLILDDILISKKFINDLHVKINYKLSRFLNARATHHGPMLEKLLKCHPDIINERAIDYKSEIWSLGKVFVELLTANPNITDFSNQVDHLKSIDPDLSVLLKIMLSDDPDLRPQSMNQVIASLAKILDRLPYTKGTSADSLPAPELSEEVNWLKKLTVALSLIVLFLVIFLGILSFFYLKTHPPDSQADRLPELIDNYTGSVGFLMVEYWLQNDEKVIYKNKIEGTAFLVDSEGFLMTNRHVACPWLDDLSLFQTFSQFAVLEKPVRFNYRMFLWFEGQKAFKRLPGLSDSIDLSDAYYLKAAFSSQGKGNLRIAGVPRSSVTTGEQLKSPFKNDFAILKIDNPPQALVPLPLELVTKSEKIQRLSPVIILGFPLGNRTQYDYINTSITRGHVRRTTKEIIQVDSSIYMGNSGGPAISGNGKVIGIASGVVTDQGSGIFKLKTPLSDFGLILPIERPAQFLETIKAGHPHWNGILDFSLAKKLDQITGLALENKFKEAAELTHEMIKKSKDPLLLYVAGMLNFCTNDLDKSRYFFRKLVLIEKENASARLMLYIIDWISGNDYISLMTRPLFNLKWHDESEFLGYLAKTLKNEQLFDENFCDWENLSEKSWRMFIDALILEKKGRLEAAQKQLKASILDANTEDWVYFLSFSHLNRIHENLTTQLEHPEQKEKEMAVFREKAAKNRVAAKNRQLSITSLAQQFESDETPHEQKIEIYQKIIKMAPENKSVLGRAAFYHATRGEWDQSITFIDRYFADKTRETALSLSLGLLKGELLVMTGKKENALVFLNQFASQTSAPWYKIIINHLTRTDRKENLVKLAAKKPEKLITLHTALGLWAEAAGDRSKAVHHYQEALSSYLDHWNEYDFALGRIMHLRLAQTDEKI